MRTIAQKQTLNLIQANTTKNEPTLFCLNNVIDERLYRFRQTHCSDVCVILRSLMFVIFTYADLVLHIYFTRSPWPSPQLLDGARAKRLGSPLEVRVCAFTSESWFAACSAGTHRRRTVAGLSHGSDQNPRKREYTKHVCWRKHNI